MSSPLFWKTCCVFIPLMVASCFLDRSLTFSYVSDDYTQCNVTYISCFQFFCLWVKLDLPVTNLSAYTHRGHKLKRNAPLRSEIWLIKWIRWLNRLYRSVCRCVDLMGNPPILQKSDCLPLTAVSYTTVMNWYEMVILEDFLLKQSESTQSFILTCGAIATLSGSSPSSRTEN